MKLVILLLILSTSGCVFQPSSSVIQTAISETGSAATATEDFTIVHSTVVPFLTSQANDKNHPGTLSPQYQATSTALISKLSGAKLPNADGAEIIYQLLLLESKSNKNVEELKKYLPETKVAYVNGVLTYIVKNTNLVGEDAFRLASELV